MAQPKDVAPGVSKGKRKSSQNGNRVPEFDRELRKAISNGNMVWLRQEDGPPFVVEILWVDPYFIKVKQDGLDWWINKSHIAGCQIVPKDA